MYRENIRYDRLDASDQDVAEAARLAGLQPLLGRLPEGGETIANLDFRNEEAIKATLEQMSQGRTTLVVAHRRSMLTHLDRALVLRNGRLEQDGSPGELVRQVGYFHDMMCPREAVPE